MIFKRFGLGLSALALFSISIDRAMAACGTCAAEDSNTVNVRFSMAGSVGAADANESTSATVNFNGVTSAGGPVLGAAEISTPIREVEVEVDKPTFAVAEVTSTASASEVSCSAFAAVTFEVGCGYLIQANYQLWNGSSWGDWSDLQTSSNGTLEVGSGSGNVKMNVRVMVVEDPSATCQSCSGDSPEAENGEDSSTTDDASPASLPNSAQDAGPMANGMPTSITPSQLSLLLRLGETEASGGMNMGWLKLNGEISQTLADVSKLTVGDRSEIGGTLHVFKVGSVIKELSNFRRLAVVTSFPTGGFKVECYGEGDYTLGSPSTLTGSPYFTLEVLPITILASVHYGGIQITRHHPNGETEVTTYLRTSNDGSSCQIVSEGGALIRELASVFTYNSNLHEWERTDVDETRRDGALISKTQETTSFQLKRDASNVVYDRAKFRRERWVYDSDSTWLTTQWNPHPDVLGRVLSVVRPDGRWEAYSYYDDYTDLTNSNRLWKHRLKTIVRPWLDGPTTPPAEPWTVSTSTAGYELVEVAYSRVGMNIVKSQERTFKNGILSNIQNFEVEEVSFTSDNEPVDGNESDLRGWLADAGVDSAWLPKAKSIFWTRSSESADASNELSEMVSNGLSFSYVSNDTDGSISAGVKTFGRWVGSFAGSVDEEGNGSVVGYERGNFSSGVFTPSSFSGTSPTMGAYLRQVRVKVLQGSVVRPHRGSREVRIIDAYGKLLREEFHVVDGSGDWKIATVRTYEYPVLWSNEHPREVIGKTWDFTEGSGGTVTLLASRILFKKEAISGYETAFWSENGEEQRVVVDQSGRLVSQTKVGVSGVQPDVVTSYDYQGLTTITTTTGGDQVARKQIVKDAAGREVASVNAAGAVIRTSYLNGGRDVLVTRPGGITELTSRNLSGDLVSRTGSGTVDEVYSYALLSNGHQVVTRRVGDDLSNSPRYVLTQTDGAGRVVEERTPSPTGTGEVTENFFYLPGTRRLERRVSPKGDFYQNVDLDLSGNGVEYSGEDFDGGGLAILSRDSLTARLSYYVKEGDDWWEVNAQRVYDGIDGSSGSFLETLSKRCLNEFADGWASWNVQVAPTGATTESTELVDWANKTVTVSTVGGGASNAVVTVNRNGLLLSRQTPEQSQPDTWEYDGLGRIVTEISARGAVKRRSYQADGSVAATTDDRGKVTRYETYGPSHTSSGLTSKIQYPDGTTRIYRYSPLGQLIEETGTAGYRVTYGYDEFGVKDRMWTWRSGSTSDQTTWVYQAGTGLLLQKKDAANQGVSYSYYPSGKVSVRTWARGVSATYTYSDGVNGSGHLIGVNYSDTTPDLTMFYGGSPTYDRMGRVYQVAQASRGTEHYRFVEGNTTVSSEQTMKGMLKEMYHSTSHQLFAERGLVFERDSYGRLNEVQETSNHWVSGFTVVRTVEYSYDANTGLLKQVDDGAQNHQYAYDANSPWVSQVQTRHTARLWFQEDRYRDAGGRILGVRSASVAGGTTATPVASHAYQYDAMNRREKETYLDGSYREIGYNDHSEVTSVSRYDSAGGAIPQLDSAYAYDGIGNRLLSSSEVIGDRSYTPNSLNQWAQVTHGSERLALGRAPTNWTVMVDGIESNRNGEIYYQGVSVDNATAPVWQTVKTKKMGATSVNTGYLWFDQAALVPSYDADGNLLSDGRWTYTWDAENRMTKMVTTTAATDAGHPYTKLEFKYDFLGRRTERAIWYKGTASSPTFKSRARWMYVGWNPVIEFSSNAGGTSLTRKLEFTWGSDLSGSMEGAGGVGGLLMQRTVSDGKLRRPAYDGNGNITAWALKGSGGTANPNMEQLRTEYDAFGNIVVSEGTLNSEFGFSTKIRDPYTGLSYYGYRYYDPVTGRWPSRDPIGERGGINLYGFVGNNAISLLDEYGLEYSEINCRNVSLDFGFSAYDVVGGSGNVSLHGEKCDCCDQETGETEKFGQFDVSVSAVATVGLGIGGKVTIAGYVVGAEVQGPQIELVNISVHYKKECGEDAKTTVDMVKAFDLKLSGTIGEGVGITVNGSARVWGGFRVEFQDRKYTSYFVYGNEASLTATVHFGLASTTFTLAEADPNESKKEINSGSF